MMSLLGQSFSDAICVGLSWQHYQSIFISAMGAWPVARLCSPRQLSPAVCWHCWHSPDQQAGTRFS